MLDPEQIKADNIRLLSSWDVAVIDHLPTLEAESELSPQAAIDVARRCTIVSHIIGIGFGGDAGKLGDAVEAFGLMEYASAHEKDMLSRNEHTEQETIDAQWLIEGMQAFAWSLGLAELEPFKHCDDDLASRFPPPFADPDDFIRSAALRPFDELYRQADVHYRLHWAAKNARLSGDELPVAEGLIWERRRALDWVIGVEADWDEMPSDT